MFDLSPLALGIQEIQERLEHLRIFCGSMQIVTWFVGFRKLQSTMKLLTRIELNLEFVSTGFLFITA